MNKEFFFKDKKLPFIECRYTQNSGKHYKPHLHNSLSIGAIDEAEVIYKVGNKEALLKPGSLAIINPQTPHSCNPLQNRRRSYYMLYLDTKWCQKIANSMYGADDINSDIILLEDRQIYDEYIETMEFFMSDGYLLEKELKMIALVERIFEKTIPRKMPTKTLTALDTNLAAKEILSLNLSDNITLEDMARKLSTNPYTLLRNFKKDTGITPHQFRMNIRIELSKKLLQKGKKIGEISLECGFFDQSHFQRYFKAMTAVTPKEYQKSF